MTDPTLDRDPVEELAVVECKTSETKTLIAAEALVAEATKWLASDGAVRGDEDQSDDSGQNCEIFEDSLHLCFS